MIVLESRTKLMPCFQGDKSSINTKGLPISRIEATLGLGIQYQPSERINIEATYQLQGRKKRIEQSAGLRLKWAF